MPITDPEKRREYHREYNREYHQKNREKILAKEREYRQKNREKLREYDREYYQKNREKRLAQQREYRQKNREKILAQKREYRQKNREKRREFRIKRTYGLTLSDISIIRREQLDACGVCSRPFTAAVRPQVDHCHASGRVRGLLCRDCNLALGHMEAAGFVTGAFADYVNDPPAFRCLNQSTSEREAA